jgi:glycosyltransferase involved in cell wall biosynthesis
LIEAACREHPKEDFGVLLTTITNKCDLEEATLELELLKLHNLNIIICDPFDNKATLSFERAQKTLESFLLRFEPSAVIILSSFEKLDSIIPVSQNQSFKRLAILYDLIPLQYQNDLLVSNSKVTSYNWALRNLSKVECLLSISQGTAAVWRSLVSKDSKIKVIYGSGYKTLKPLEINSSDERSGILCVGAEQNHKNIDNLIRAYSLFLASCPDKHQLTILGINSTGARARLKKFATSLNVSVIFPNYLTDLELIYLYASSKLLVMPSLVEGLSMPILEAWEMGLPVIGSAGTVAEELIMDSKLLFNPNDINSIAVTIQNLLTDEIAWQQEAKSLKNRVDQYSWRATAKLVLEAVLEEIKHD